MLYEKLLFTFYIDGSEIVIADMSGGRERSEWYQVR